MNKEGELDPLPNQFFMVFPNPEGLSKLNEYVTGNIITQAAAERVFKTYLSLT